MTMRGVYRNAELSEAAAGGDGVPTYRWTLERSWARPASDTRPSVYPYVCWIMLNPSTADAQRDDPTVRRCMEFTNAWGYGRLIIVNLYPLRTSDPQECRRWAGVNGTPAPALDRDALQHNAAIDGEARRPRRRRLGRGRVGR